MPNLTFKEYAQKNGISYEGVRKQVERYAADLEGHVISNGKSKMLDDFAQEFLRGHRATGAVSYDFDKDEQIKLMRDREDQTKDYIIKLQGEINRLQAQIIEEKKDKERYMLESMERLKLGDPVALNKELKEENAKLMLDVERLKESVDVQQKRADEAEERNSREVMTSAKLQTQLDTASETSAHLIDELNSVKEALAKADEQLQATAKREQSEVSKRIAAENAQKDALSKQEATEKEFGNYKLSYSSVCAERNALLTKLESLKDVGMFGFSRWKKDNLGD